MWRRFCVRVIQRSRQTIFNKRWYTGELAHYLAWGIGIGMVFAIIGRCSAETVQNPKNLKDTCLDTDLDMLKRYKELPVYTLEDVRSHSTLDSLWVVVNGCVYDITTFLTTHPGGDRILGAKGRNVEPFWQVYPIHYTSPLVMQQLDSMRIGVLCSKDRDLLRAEKRAMDANSPFAGDPARSPQLQVMSSTPFNGESPAFANTSIVTPTLVSFIRNHHAVPPAQSDEDQVQIRVHPEVWSNMQQQGYAVHENDGTAYISLNGTRVSPAHLDSFLGFEEPSGLSMTLPVAQLNTLFPSHQVRSTIVCAGNRRVEMTNIEPTDGLSWSSGAASTSDFGGVRIPDLLAALGISERTTFDYPAHLAFRARDDPFAVSVPLSYVLPLAKSAIQATSMNGEPIPRDHGELRAVLPGTVGVRNTKWVRELEVLPRELQSTWQTGAPYKIFPQHLKSFKDINTADMPSLNEMPVMSVITTENQLQSDSCSEKVKKMIKSQTGTEPTRCVRVQGWAYSGGGTGIVRVDLTSDKGASWVETDIDEGPSKAEIDANQAWYWSLWSGEVPVSSDMAHATLSSRAVDARGNVQPEQVRQIWNKRGILNNAWFSRKFPLAHPEILDDE